MGDAPCQSIYQSAAFLREHGRSILAFYLPRCVDPDGGFYHYYRDDGRVYDAGRRHLVSSCRFVVNFCWAAGLYGPAGYDALIRHGLDFLENRHFDAGRGGYRWDIDRDGSVHDGRFYAYGHAFVLLAYAETLAAGVAAARAPLERVYEILERRFWEPAHGLYADIAAPDWTLDGYRGQNANMHLCEALLAAHRASGEACYLDRALLLADRMTRRQAAAGDGLVWEHYRSDWTPDWEFHKDRPDDLFRPWGFQPGHQIEWAKLLLQLEQRLDPDRRQDWLLARAQTLFDRAWAIGWDAEHGGLVYGVAPDGAVCSGAKHFWVQAEAIAAAALLARRSGDDRYLQRYEQLWDYSSRHLIDHRYGAWRRVLNRDNSVVDDRKSPAGKTDYHTLGMCRVALEALSG